MIQVYDQITIDRIKTLHPKIRQQVLEAYLYINNKLLGKGVRLRFAYTYRSPQEQNKLYQYGRTVFFDEAGNRKGKVTNAQAWGSFHQYALAFDIVLLLDKDLNGTFEVASWDTVKDFDKDGQSDWMEVVNYLKSLGFEWGGDWKKFKDKPHFQKVFGYTTKQLYSKIKNKDYFTEIINGQEIKYVNI